MKLIFRKITAICIVALMMFGSLPSFAEIQITNRQYSANGSLLATDTHQMIKNASGQLVDTIVSSAKYDANGRLTSGFAPDSNNVLREFSLTYDAYGNQQTYTSWNAALDGGAGAYQTVFSVNNIVDGKLKGSLNFTVKGGQTLVGTMQSLSFESFLSQLNTFKTTGYDPNTFLGKALIGISGTLDAIMDFLGGNNATGKANLGKLLGLTALNAEKKADADAAANAKKGTSVSYDIYDTSLYLNEVWAQLTDPANANAIVYFTFGQDKVGGVVYATKVTFDVAGQPQKTVLPQKCATGGTSYVNPPDPLVTGAVQGTWQDPNTGLWYLMVTADQIDMYDGQGPRQGDGETIYIQMDKAQADAMAAEASANGGFITISGNVQSNVGDKKVLTMNEGGYKTGSSVLASKALWMTSNLSFYNNMVNSMASTWAKADQSQKNDWTKGWDFLVSQL